LFGYQNQHDLMRTMFTALKNEPATPSSFDRLSSLFNLPFGSPQKSFSDWLDFSLLPDFDQVSKYFYFSVYSGDTTADGLSFKVFAPRPPQMN
jgi:hypothetical protein